MAGAKKLEVQIIGDSASLSRAFNNAGKSGSRFGATIGTLGKLAGVAMLGIGAGAAVAGKRMLSMASDAAEVQSKMEVVFGSTLPGLTKNIDKFSAATGTSRFEMREQVADMGALLEPLTANKQKAADLSLQFTKLATDLGSFNNVPTADALLAIRSGLVGEAEPLRRFGVLLNESAVKQEALSLGLVKGKQVLTEQQKVQARASLIMKQTTLAQGDATRTAGSMANQMKRLKSNISDTATSMGKALIPAALGVTKVLNDLFKAKGFKAKLNVVFDFGKSIFNSIQKALLGGTELKAVTPGHHLVEVFKPGLQQAITGAIAGIDWTAAWNKASGIGEGLAARFAAIDWTSVGKTIGDGIAAGMSTASSFGPKIAESVLAASRTIDWVALGRAMGPGLAAALATAFVTLMDPGFWAKNWDLALAVFLAAFGKGIGKIVAPVGRLLVRFGGDAVLAIVAGIEAMSPKIASVLLAVLTKLPSLVSKALGLLLAPVKAVFAKLGALATFVVKVLGVQAAIQAVVAFAGKVKEWLDRVVAWFAGLPGRIKGAIPSPGSILNGIGSAIIEGLWGGMRSRWLGVQQWLGGLGGAIKGLKGPLAKDKVLLFQEGHAIMTGLGEGMQAGWVRNVQFLRGVSAGILREINAIQGQLDAINLRRETQDRAAAVRDATAALAEARKKKEGVAAAELALARAREDIAVAGLTAQLTKEQALYDRRALMIQGKMDKLQAILQRAQDKAAALFDRMQAKIMRAFDATRGGIVTPAEAALAAINDARRNNDLQKALAEAVASGDTEAILRAQEDIQIASLERQAANERTALDQQTEAMREKLEDKLATMLTVWKGGTASILELLKGYGIDFANVGALLGDAFRQSLLDAITGAGKAKVAVQAATANVASGSRMPAMATGGRVLSDGAAFLHRGETVVPARASNGGGWGNGDIVIKIGEDEIARAVRNGDSRYYRANGPLR